MKKIIRLLLAVVLLAGSTSTIALADGTNPPPDCDPFTNPHCPVPPLATMAR